MSILRVGLALLLVSATACRDGGQAPATGAAVAPGAGPSARSDQPRVGGALVLPSLEPTTLNPLLERAFELVTPLLFEGLVGLDARLEPQPRLAERWDVSADGRKITFHLRRGVTWHDGQPFTAADVIHTVEQIRTAPVPVAMRGYLEPVERVEAPDPHTVEVTYRQAHGPALATWTFAILPRHVYTGKDLASAEANQAPVGTGPFRFVRWVQGRSIHLEAHAAYWGGRAYLDRVEVVFAPPSDVWLEALRAGKLDFAPINRPEDWTGELQTPEFRARHESTMVGESSFVAIAWNCQRKPFSDRRVRLGLIHALDRARVIEDLLAGSGRLVSSPFYPTMWGADPSIAPWPFDLARAAALLDEAGVRAPRAGEPRFRVRLIALESRRGSPYSEMFAVFRNDLAKVDVELEVAYLPTRDFVSRLMLRDFDAAAYEWLPDIADPDPTSLLHSTQIGEGANYAAFAHPEVDRLIEEGRAAVARADRKKAYFALHRLLHEEQPYAFLYAPQAHYAWSRRLHGVNPLDVGPFPRLPGLARWWIEP